MVAFVKAKEEFKHKKTLPGILYSDVIRLVSHKKKIEKVFHKKFDFDLTIFFADIVFPFHIFII